jgi:cell division inhibitor SulA
MTNASASTRTTLDFMLPLLIELEKEPARVLHSMQQTTKVIKVWLQRTGEDVKTAD